MTVRAEELVELMDREKIRDCLARLARGEDRRNHELITGAYWPSAFIDHGIFAGSFAEYLAWVQLLADRWSRAGEVIPE